MGRPEWWKFSEFFSSRDVYKSAEECDEFMRRIRSEFKDIDGYIRQTEVDYELIDRMSAAEREVVRQEFDATEMALRIANMIPRKSYSWSPTRNGKSSVESFFSGLKPSRFLEDDVVRWDLDKIPGLSVIDRSVFGHYVMSDGRSTLHTFHANKNALEHTMGVDLIYFNERKKSFVLVQYKMAESVESDHVFRFPNAQLSKEISRMENVMDALDAESAGGEDLASDYRMISNPFFLKICRRGGFDPDSNEQLKGMVIPFDLWKAIERDGSNEFIGPSGGKYLGFRNCPRYIDNTHFIYLLKEGWIGTTSKCCAFLEKVITDILNDGRSLIFAAKLPSPRLVDDGGAGLRRKKKSPRTSPNASATSSRF